MNNMNRIRNTGIVCITAAIIWIMAISIEYPLDLQPPRSGSIFYLYWAALFLPLAIASQEPKQITETIWGFAWLLIGLVLLKSIRNPEVVTI